MGNLQKQNNRYLENMTSMEETVYEVEQIDDDRLIKGKKQYFIKWRNFPVSDNTWEPEENLDCPDLIARYEDMKKQKQSIGATAGNTSENLQGTLLPTGAGPVGFARGLKPEKIMGATDATGKLYYLIKWEHSDRCDLVKNSECHEKCPNLVIKYLEERLTWKTWDNKENVNM